MASSLWRRWWRQPATRSGTVSHYRPHIESLEERRVLNGRAGPALLFDGRHTDSAPMVRSDHRDQPLAGDHPMPPRGDRLASDTRPPRINHEPPPRTSTTPSAPAPLPPIVVVAPVTTPPAANETPATDIVTSTPVESATETPSQNLPPTPRPLFVAEQAGNTSPGDEQVAAPLQAEAAERTKAAFTSESATNVMAVNGMDLLLKSKPSATMDKLFDRAAHQPQVDHGNGKESAFQFDLGDSRPLARPVRCLAGDAHILVTNSHGSDLPPETTLVLGAVLAPAHAPELGTLLTGGIPFSVAAVEQALQDLLGPAVEAYPALQRPWYWFCVTLGFLGTGVAVEFHRRSRSLATSNACFPGCERTDFWPEDIR